MRYAALAVVSLALMGCATTVSRMPGPVETPGGDAAGACESQSMLTLGKTQYSDLAPGSERTLQTRRDGIGVYPVGQSAPLSASDLEERVGSAEIFQRHREGHRKHDQDRWIAAGLGAGAAAALAVGTIVLVGAFDTETTVRPDGSRDEEQVISGGQAALGGLIIGAGFGLGIGGVLMAPTAAERARADAARYVYRKPPDDLDDLRGRIGRHNEQARQRCVSPKAAR